MFKIFTKNNNTPQNTVEQLYEDGYKSRLITQIQKAAEKGYDISSISPDTNIDKLKSAVSNLSSKKATEYELLSLLFAIKDHDISELTNELAINNAYMLIAEWNDNINPLCYNATNNKGSNIKRINQIANRGLKINVDIYDYIKQGYNTGEIEQILIGLEKNINIDKYLTPDLDRDRIQGLVYISEYQQKNKCFTQEQFDEICKRKYTLKTLKKIGEVKSCDKDISPILKKPLDTKQAHVILAAIKDGYDVSTMINEKLTTEQLNSIYMGLRVDIDTSIYADENFTGQQMDIIRTGLVYNKTHKDTEIDLSPILNSNITPYLMKKYLKVKEDGNLDEIISVLKDIEIITLDPKTKDLNIER